MNFIICPACRRNLHDQCSGVRGEYTCVCNCGKVKQSTSDTPRTVQLGIQIQLGQITLQELLEEYRKLEHEFNKAKATDVTTLRDYFAAHVTVDESDIPATKGQCCELIGVKSFPPETDVLERMAACAKLEAVIRGMKADAMIEEREKFLARTKSKA